MQTSKRPNMLYAKSSPRVDCLFCNHESLISTEHFPRAVWPPTRTSSGIPVICENLVFKRAPNESAFDRGVELTPRELLWPMTFQS